jgi:hypothetical protein
MIFACQQAGQAGNCDDAWLPEAGSAVCAAWIGILFADAVLEEICFYDAMKIIGMNFIQR